MQFLPTEEKVIKDIYNDIIENLPEEYLEQYKKMSSLRLREEIHKDFFEIIVDEIRIKPESFENEAVLSSEICSKICVEICEDPELTPEDFDRILSKMTLFK